jgi:hypothetical protein
LEKDVAKDLEDKGIPFEYEAETFPYTIPEQVHKYTPDIFLTGKLKGRIIEVKGRWTAQDRKKMGLFMEQYPKIDIRMLFERDHKISKNSRTRYSDWCTKRGIIHAFGRAIPEEWLT